MMERKRDYANNPIAPRASSKKVVVPEHTRANNPIPPKPKPPKKSG